MTATSLREPQLPLPAKAGDTFEGRVARLLEGGRAEIRTAIGALIVDTRLAMEVGRAVLLTVLSTGPPARLHLALPSAGPTARPLDSASSLLGLSLQATFLGPHGATPAVPDAASVIRPTGTVPPVPPAAATTEPAPGSTAAVRIVALGGTAGTRSLPADAVRGTVVAGPPGGNTVVRTPLGDLALPVRGGPPPGTPLVLRIESIAARPGTPPPPAALDALSPRWEALARALPLLASEAEQTVGANRAAPAHSVPRPGPGLAGSLLFLISALRGGDIRHWLGEDAARALQRSGMLGQLAEDFGTLQRLAGDPAGPEWRMFLLPVLVDERLEQLRLYLRRQDAGGRGDADDSETATRFLIEVAFERHGAFQFDGLSWKKRFDLLIRTEATLAPDLQAGIARVFADVVSTLGIDGRISFSVERPFSVRPLAEVVGASERDARTVLA